MKFKISFLAFLCVLLSIQPGMADSNTDRQDRLEKPYQIQFVLPGTSSNYQKGRDSMEQPIRYGFHVGYNISEMIYLGLTSKMSVGDYTAKLVDNDDDDNNNYKEETYGQPGARPTEIKDSTDHLLEARFYPWKFNLYFSGGVLFQGEETSKTAFNQRTRTINGNSYTTGLKTNLRYQAQTVPVVGFGYNPYLGNGLTLGVGMSLALGAQQKPDVDVTAVNNQTVVASADLDYLKEQIETNESRGSHMVYFSIGYAF